MKDYSRFN